MNDLAYAQKMRELFDACDHLTVQLREYRLTWREYTAAIERDDPTARRAADSRLLKLWNGMIESERYTLYAIMDRAERGRDGN